MAGMPEAVHIVRASVANAIADLRVIYTWRSWLFAWVGRMLAQVTFYAFIGKLIDSSAQTRFLVIGNAVMVCAIESMLVVASTAWERDTGTWPLLTAAPANAGW